MKNFIRKWRAFIEAALLILIVVGLITESVIALQIVTVEYPRLPPMALTSELTVSAYPLVAPTITNNGGASGVTDNDATLNGEITSTGNEDPTTIVYWGPTDNGTDAGAWTNNHTLGIEPLGAVSYTATDNFTASTTYFYRYYCYNSAGSDWADSTANFTTASGAYNPPTGLTLTDLGGITVTANWTKEATANNTLIRISRSHYPTSITDEEWWFFNVDSSVNITGVDLEVMTLYVSAWSELGGNYSASYAYASIGGTGLDNLATSVNATANAILSFAETWNTQADSQALIWQTIITLILLITFAVLAFWKGDKIIYLVSGIMFIIYGLSYIATSWPMSVALIAIGVIIAVKGWVQNNKKA